MWIVPVFFGLFIAYKLLDGKHITPKGTIVRTSPESQEILKEYNDILEKLDASPYGPFMRVSPQNAALTWTTPTGTRIVINITKNKVFDKLVGEVVLYDKGRMFSETTILYNESPSPSKTIMPILTRMLSMYSQ